MPGEQLWRQCDDSSFCRHRLNHDTGFARALHLPDQFRHDFGSGERQARERGLADWERLECATQL